MAESAGVEEPVCAAEPLESRIEIPMSSLYHAMTSQMKQRAFLTGSRARLGTPSVSAGACVLGASPDAHTRSDAL